MKLIIQTVNSADVLINNQIKREIKSGLLVYVGFKVGDSIENITKAVYKLSGLRVFSDENGKINLSLNDINGEILIISNFTLYASLKKGFRPSFDEALKSEEGKILYDKFIFEMMNIFKDRLKTGEFGADMLVTSVNSGPKNYIYEI